MNQQLLVQDRIRKIVAITIVIFLLFGLRLIEIQAIRANGYVEKVDVELGKTATLLAPRGNIYDINGIELARSISAINIAVDQTVVNDPVAAAKIVAPILGMTPSQLLPDITGERRYVLIAKDVTPAKWNAVYEGIEKYNSNLLKSKAGISKRIGGFVPERSYIRDYPSGLLTASLVGIINDQGVGASGIESSLNNLLAGTNGKYAYANGRGKIIPGSERVSVEAKAGTSIRLTIDRDIQWVAQNAINQAVASARAQSGTVIVMDPKTGAILAQASAPTFDPNNASSITLDKLRNPAVQDVYEPGSTGKVMTLAAALEEKTVAPTTVFAVPYKIKRGGSTFKDHDKHPVQHLTTSGILAVSSNTGTIKIGETISNDKLYSYLTKFGVGEKTGSGLPGESAGLMPKVENWSGTTAPTVAFGQGYSVTAMQATSVFATIANHGVRVSPTVIAGTQDASGHFTPAANRTTTRVVSESTARELRLMMESVVSPTGTAPSAAIPGYRVAGKTGTAWRYNDKTGGYSGYTASFIGFAPADAPRYVINVTIQDPHNGYYGGLLGGPVFKKVMTFVLQTKHVAPTGTKVMPVALNQKDLTRMKATQVSAEKSGAVRQ